MFSPPSRIRGNIFQLLKKEKKKKITGFCLITYYVVKRTPQRRSRFRVGLARYVNTDVVLSAVIRLQTCCVPNKKLCPIVSTFRVTQVLS